MHVGLVAEQLRRRVPGGIGTYVIGLLQGLERLRAMPQPGVPVQRSWGVEGVEGFQSVEAVQSVEGVRDTQRVRDTQGMLDVEGGSAPSALRPPADVSLLTSRLGRSRRDLERWGLPLVESALPAAALVRLWERGLGAPKTRFDVLHAPSLVAPPVRSTPLVVTVHDVAWRTHPEAFPARGRRWHERSLRRSLERAAAVVVPSDATAACLGPQRAQVVVIEEGADHLPPPDEAAASAVLSDLGVRGPYALCVGTLEPRKNLPRLLAAWGIARSRLGDDWSLVLVGPTGWGPALQPLPGSVLAGRVPAATLAGMYTRAALAVYVPLTEGFGLPAVEAMAHGAPLVASRVPAAAEAAHFVDPLEPESIAEGIVQVATDSGVAARLVRAGRERARGLTWATVAGRHLQLWEEVAA